MTKVFDCFTFFDEFDILELRFNELFDVVDYFVICEASTTFTNKPKPMHFKENAARFERFLSKVIYVPITEFPSEHDVWVREEFQRECLERGLDEAEPDDLVIISDVDEIPRAEVVERLKSLDGLMQLKMDMFQYFLNLRERVNDWNAAYALRMKYRKALDCSPGGTKSLSYARFHIEEIAQTQNIELFKIDKSGWHFTHLGGVEKLLLKFNSYSHTNDPWPSRMKNPQTLMNQIALGVRIWSGDDLAEYVPIDDSYPRYVVENQERFREIGFLHNVFQAHHDLQRMHVALKRQFAFASLPVRRPLEALGDLTPLQYIELSNLNWIDWSFVHLPEPHGVLVSQGKPATQSSVCTWSRAPTVEEDAAGAVNGHINGHYKFHTDAEQSPWWRVDLGEVEQVSEIRVFNRLMPDSADRFMENRARNLVISVSTDGENFQEVYHHAGKPPFGGIDSSPLIWVPEHPLEARFVRLHITDHEALHLDQVEVYARQAG